MQFPRRRKSGLACCLESTWDGNASTRAGKSTYRRRDNSAVKSSKKKGNRMAITVVGSVAFDSIETPAGRRERCLGGAATYFSLSASFFTDVRGIAVVGEGCAGRRLPF